ncbi:RNA polymerase sigma factor [Pseudodesulfovibrio sp.]|uniref:RNA polymerase sigma factor n=1 Tax=Pseudodesulfovibrio sp. TaxID=2035812 RepID=UPI002602870C|nr:RNA polymerase sigma factor [Pseudodesulfovibrio sp.]MDD3313610.1 RNA polymerase sigma factor [Pseudodesulfovibrio sp.]
MGESTETELIREVLGGDPRPFETLVRRYQGPVFNLMLRQTGDFEVSADLAQEAFVRAYTRLETFRPGNRFFPWLYSLALNVVRDWMRKSGRDLHVFMEDPAVMEHGDGGEDAERAASRRMDGALAFEKVMGLAPKYREALILRFRHDLSMKEIGQALDITVSGAKMRVSRGLELVRQQLEEASDAE